MREELIKLGCAVGTHEYLGDGIYCGRDDAKQIWLVVQRESEYHAIALDGPTAAALYRYAHITELP